MLTQKFLTNLRDSLLNSRLNVPTAYCRPKGIVLEDASSSENVFYIFSISYSNKGINEQGVAYIYFTGYFENNTQAEIQVHKEYVVGETDSGNPSLEEILQMFVNNDPQKTNYILAENTLQTPYTIGIGEIQGYKVQFEFQEATT